MSCYECIHYDVCRDQYKNTLRCSEFKNKANFIEVCHCKDCNSWKRNIGFIDSPNGHCFYCDMDTNGFDYCCWGERRDAE